MINLILLHRYLVQAPLEIGSKSFGDIGSRFPKTKAAEFLKYLISPELQQKLYPLKIVFIVITLLFIFAILYFLFYTSFLDWRFLRGVINFLFPKSVGKKLIARKWEKNKKRLERGKSPAEWKDALIESFNLFDRILEDIGYQGKTLEEKVEKLSKDEFSNIEEVKSTIKLCRDIIKDPDYRIDKERAMDNLEVFEKALEEQGFM